MCGIFGLIDFENGALKSRSLVERATDLMSHRGPDGRGVWIENAAAFGHRRLAIIDPAGSPQPMLSSDARYALTYNGELYNFRQLRDELIGEGIEFRTKGDTEVVLEALRHWGKEALVRFNGMFAFGFWDSQLERLLIARDRLGVKPLLFCRNNRWFAFASEYPPLLALDRVSRNPDPVGVTAYLSHFQTSFDGKTIYRDISSLDGGEYAEFDRDGFSKHRYWKLPAIPSQVKRELWPDSRIPDAAQEVRRLMGEAIRSHSIADVTVGVFLSGGIDSALIATLMCDQSNERVKAYSIGFAEEGFNEFEFAGAITANLGLSHRIVTFDDAEYFPMMTELIRHKAAPLSTPNEIPIQALSRTAAQELKVVLTGEGSDELFGGYTEIFRSPEDLAMSERLRNDPASMNPEERMQIRDALRNFYGKSGFRGELDHWTTAYAWLSRREINQVLGQQGDLKKAAEEIDACWRSKLNGLEGLSTFDRYLYLFETEHLRGLLARLDACTMAGSLEGRVPFTDNALVEFAWGLPFEYKLRWREESAAAGGFDSSEESVIGKYILKQAFSGLISDTISSRKKRAFPVPLEVWMNGSGRERVMYELGKASAGANQIVGRDVVNWAKNTLATGVGAMKVWMVWNLAEWLEGNV